MAVEDTIQLNTISDENLLAVLPTFELLWRDVINKLSELSQEDIEWVTKQFKSINREHVDYIYFFKEGLVTLLLFEALSNKSAGTVLSQLIKDQIRNRKLA